MFAVQDEITEAIVAAIEPQIYAAENFRARRKPPDSLDAWDLVMRALSHYWRVTREDNLVAQELLERAIAIDPQLRPGARRACRQPHVRRPHGLGRQGDRAPRRRARGAGGGPRRQRGSLGAPRAGLRLMCSRGASTTRWPSSKLALRLNPNFSLAHGYYGVALAYCGRWEEGRGGRTPRAAVEPARSVLGDLLWRGRLSPSSSGDNYDEAMRLARTAIRLRGDFVGAHRVLTAAAGMAGQVEVAAAALQELRRAQPNISLAWIADQMPIKHDADREHYLEGFRRAGLD